MEVIQGEDVKVDVRIKLVMTYTEYIVFQLRLIFGSDCEKLSMNDLTVLAYFFMYPVVSDCKDKLIGDKIRKCAQSVSNDIVKFKKEGLIEISNGTIVMNAGIKLLKDRRNFLIEC